MNRFTGSLLNTQRIIQTDQGLGRIVGTVGKFFITDLLNCGVLHTIDTKTARIKCTVSLGTGIPFFLHQVFQNLFDHGIGIIRVDAVIFCFRRSFLDPGVDIIGQCCLIISICNVALFQHGI